jgi:hypothetical protein
LGLSVDPQSSLARYLAGEIQMFLQFSSNLVQWATLPFPSAPGAEGAFFSVPASTNKASFYRVVIPPP